MREQVRLRPDVAIRVQANDARLQLRLRRLVSDTAISLCRHAVDVALCKLAHVHVVSFHLLRNGCRFACKESYRVSCGHRRGGAEEVLRRVTLDVRDNPSVEDVQRGQREDDSEAVVVLLGERVSAQFEHAQELQLGEQRECAVESDEPVVAQVELEQVPHVQNGAPNERTNLVPLREEVLDARVVVEFCERGEVVVVDVQHLEAREQFESSELVYAARREVELDAPVDVLLVAPPSHEFSERCGGDDRLRVALSPFDFTKCGFRECRLA